jgi:F-box-like
MHQVRPTLLDSTIFTSLPPEIHLLILSHLDLISLFNATTTSHYFHSLLIPSVLKKALLAHEEVLLASRMTRDIKLRDAGALMTEQEKRRTLAMAACLPCYNCLQIKDLRNHFHEYVERTEWRLCGEKAKERLCIHCDVLVSSASESFFMRVINGYREQKKRARISGNVP